jgi:hypothetical protein
MAAVTINCRGVGIELIVYGSNVVTRRTVPPASPGSLSNF